MFQRDVNITRDLNIADPGGLLKHPKVRKCWRLPRRFTLFEFYDPVFEIIYNLDPRERRSTYGDEALGLRVRAALDEERELMAPLFESEKNKSSRIQLAVPCRTALYEFLDKQVLQWPHIGYSPDWETSPSARISGQLVKAIPETVEALQTVFKEWLEAMTKLGEINRAQPITFAGEDFSTVCEFTGPCGDATMALYMLLTDTRALTSAQAVGFFLPTDTAAPSYHRIGYAG